MNRNLSAIQKKSSKRNPGRRAGKFVFVSLFLLILVIVLLVIVLPGFYIQKITITGNSLLPTDQLLETSGIRIGDHIMANLGGSLISLFSLHYGNIEKDMADKYPYIDTINIRVSFPSEVLVSIQERKKIAYLQVPDGYAVVDYDGYVVEISAQTAPAGVPLIEGLPVTSAALGDKLKMSSEVGFDHCITVFGAILGADANKIDGTDFSLMSCVKNIRYVGNYTTFLTITLPNTSREVLIRIGSLKEISDDMMWLRYAVSSGVLDSTATGVFDMSGEDYTMRKSR